MELAWICHCGTTVDEPGEACPECPPDAGLGWEYERGEWRPGVPEAED